jgi:hypothetical protein
MPAPKTKPAPRRSKVATKRAGPRKPMAANLSKQENGIAEDATRLADKIEKALADGKIDTLPPESLQDLMAALCRTYSARVEAGQDILPLRGRTTVSSTDIMTTASGLLKSANLAVFELGMWQSWTGR